MAGEAGSFRVHLQSLKEFAARLRDQVQLADRSTDAVQAINQAPSLSLGGFAEAYALSDRHGDAAQQLATVLATVVRSLDFARSVTELVAQRYEALNRGGAQAIGSVGAAIPPVPPLPGPPITGTAAPPAGSRLPPPAAGLTAATVPPAIGTVYYATGAGPRQT
ncbi:MAG TPA: hypothetical protein VIL37_14240 [Natronosporangium sp.]